MSIGDVLKNLIVDSWYKAFVYLGAVIFVISLFSDAKGLTNAQVQMLSAGLFLFGTGEWVNHKRESFFKENNFWTGGPALISYTVRKPDLFGLFLDLLGIVVLALALWNIMKI